MATNTGTHALIGFLKDYMKREEILAHEDLLIVTRSGGLRTNKPVGIAHKDSTEFLLVETFDRLEVIRHAVAVAWNSPRRFEELEECLAGKALTSFKRLVRNRCLNPVDKTDANYEELYMLMPTDLGDQTYLRNKICQYVDQKVM